MGKVSKKVASPVPVSPQPTKKASGKDARRTYEELVRERDRAIAIEYMQVFCLWILSPVFIVIIGTVLSAFIFTGYEQDFASKYYLPSPQPAEWFNNANTASCKPMGFRLPQSEEDVIAIIQEAKQEGEKVKVVGAGASTSNIACSKGILLNLDNYSKPVGVNSEKLQATFEAGIRLKDMFKYLDSHGLSVAAAPAYHEVTLGGAIATGAHGSSLRHSSFTKLVTEMRLVDASGRVHVVSEELEPDIFDAAVLGLGVVGVITQVTIQCVPAYNLEKVETGLIPIDQMIMEMPKHWQNNDHFLFYWIPSTDKTRGIMLNKVDRPVETGFMASYREFYDEKVMHPIDVISTAEAALPRLQYILHNFMASFSTPRNRTGNSLDILRLPFVSSVSWNSEYYVPMAQCGKVLKELVKFFESRPWLTLNTVVVVRLVKGDDVHHMSPVFEQDSCSFDIPLHRSRGSPYLLHTLHDFFAGQGARANWAKMHKYTGSDFVAQYTHRDEFVTLARKVDPEGMFLNDDMANFLGIA